MTTLTSKTWAKLIRDWDCRIFSISNSDLSFESKYKVEPFTSDPKRLNFLASFGFIFECDLISIIKFLFPRLKIRSISASSLLEK